MAIDGKTYTDEVIRLADLFTTTDVLEGYDFHNCLLTGPIVLAPVLGCRLVNCGFDGELDGMLWQLPVPNGYNFGGVTFVNSSFTGCQFVRVGITGPADFLEYVRSALS